MRARQPGAACPDGHGRGDEQHQAGQPPTTGRYEGRAQPDGEPVVHGGRDVRSLAPITVDGRGRTFQPCDRGRLRVTTTSRIAHPSTLGSAHPRLVGTPAIGGQPTVLAALWTTTW